MGNKNRKRIFLYRCLKICYLYSQSKRNNKSVSDWVPGVPTIYILASLPNTLDRHPWVNKLPIKGWRSDAVNTEATHVNPSDEETSFFWNEHLDQKQIVMEKKISQGGVKLLQTGTGEETQCSPFISTLLSGWVSNTGKFTGPWEIIIKQRATHSAQYGECVNAGGAQVSSPDLISGWWQHNRRNKGLHRARGWRTVLWLGLMLHAR